jgi:glutamate dehydrogenase/leucine dehydrogenase
MVEYDEFGPEKIIQVYDPQTGLHGITVIDNTALGPAKGGIRMTPTVSIDEVARLARAMTWKCSLAELPFGGGKSGIVADPKQMKPSQKNAQIAAFGRALRHIAPREYIAAPDMNIGEYDIEVFVKGNGNLKSATGKPSNLCVAPGQCGIPHEYGSTGFGVFHSTLVAAEHLGIKIKGATIAIEGFGNVGTFAMKYLAEAGANVVAVSDSKGTIYNKDGIDFEKLSETKKKTGSVANYAPGKKIKNSEIFELDVDVLIPSAIPDVINESNVKKVKAKILAEAANIPMKLEMEDVLHKRGVLVIPDFICNAGGVISSYAEHKGENPKDMFKLVEEKIKKNTKLVLENAKKNKIKPRDAGMEIAVKRVKDAMKERTKL